MLELKDRIDIDREVGKAGQVQWNMLRNLLSPWFGKSLESGLIF